MPELDRKKFLFQPRSYQLHYLEKAKKQNIICCLGTGAGKTFISIMLLKEYADQMKNNQMKSIFLCPTIPLVNQQADEIQQHTNQLFRTKKFYGRTTPDSWSLENWHKEIDSTDLLVITPETFYKILSKQFIDIKKICLLIFDECHHAGLKRNKTGKSLTETNHPYKRIMKFVSDKNMKDEIRIVGLTASVVNACYDRINLSDCVKELQYTFNSKIYGEINFDPRFLAEPDINIFHYDRPIEINSEFDKLFSIQTELKKIIENQMIDEETAYFNNMLNISKYECEKPSFKYVYIEKMIRDLSAVHDELGIYPAYLVCLEFKNELENSKSSIKDLNTGFLIASTIQYLEFCEQLYSNIIRKTREEGKDPILGLITSKLSRLLDIVYLFHGVHQEFAALIFVDRVIFSYAISKYLEELSNSFATYRYSFIRPNFFVGTSNDYLNFKFIRHSVKNFNNTIKEFKNGIFNLMVTTAVLEEGIDIGKCNLVVRFNEANTYREFVQSKGRARAKGSHFVMMHENSEESNYRIQIFNNTEDYLNHCFKKSKEEEALNIPIQFENHEMFEAEVKESFESATGSLISLSESAAFLQRYIRKKGNHSYAPTYSFNEIGEGEEKLYIFTLSLVGVTPLKNKVVGKPYPDQKDAFKSTCLACIKQLYEIGQLDEHFIPISVEQVFKKCALIDREYSNEELVELDFMFDKKVGEKLFFKKQIANFDQFKKSIKSNSIQYDMYEIIFHFKDEDLNEDDEKLVLLTRLDLDEIDLYFKIQHDSNATIELKLIKKNVTFDEDQLKRIDRFTFKVFENAIPALKKRKDVEFDIEKSIFKFSFFHHSQIDYDQMNKFIETTSDEKEEDENNLIKTIHTDGVYKLVSDSNVLPSDMFYWKNSKKHITYNQYFKQKFNKIIKDQQEKLILVERIDRRMQNEDKSSKARYHFPKEFCVITSLTIHLDRKLTSLPLVISQIKQQILINKILYTFDQEIINCNQLEDSIFKYSIENNNIIEYSSNSRFQNDQQEQDDENLKSSSSSSSSSDDEDSDFSENENEIDEKLTEIFEPKSPKKKEITKISNNRCKKHLPIDQNCLNQTVNDSMKTTLDKSKYSNFDELLNNFVDLIELTSEYNLSVNYENSDSKVQMEKKTKNQLIDLTELKNIDFNFWTNELSNKFLIHKDKLIEALTIQSETNLVNLERLEFLGDIFLKLNTCSLLFHHYPDSVVGELDLMKNEFVSNKNLYIVSRRKKILEYMISDKKILPGSNWLPDGFRFTSADPNDSDILVTLVDSNGEQVFNESKLNMVDKNQFTQLRPKSIADNIESLIGSVLVSTGIRNTCLFMKYIGIYSNQFKLDLNSQQKNWFIEGAKKYDPLTNDPLGNLAKFTKEMYLKYNFKNLETKIGYEFVNKSLLIQAFKHASHNDLITFPSFENLEFLGDAVIDYLIVKYIFDDKIKYTPSELTSLKQSLINNNFFGTISVKYGLDNYLILKCELLFNSISTYKSYFNRTLKDTDKLMIPSTYLILNDPETINFVDTVEVPKILSDIFESLIGAVFIDSDFCLNTVWNVLIRFMSNELIKFKQNVPKSFTTVLHDLYPKAEFSECKCTENGLKSVEIQIDDQLFIGEGESKKAAKNDAAKKVIKYHLKID